MNKAIDDEQYFSVPLTTNVNIEVLDEQFPALDLDLLEQTLPMPFRLAGDLQQLDQRTARSLRKLGELGDELVEYLTQQAKKLDILMAYILSLQNDPEHCFETQEVGASGISFLYPEPLEAGARLQIKLFIPEEQLAIFAFATVTRCEKQPTTDAPPSHVIATRFSALRESDQEALIRATLHIQSRRLKSRSQHNE